MIRHLTAASLVGLLCVGSVLAAEIDGKLKSVNLGKSSVVLDVDGKDREFTVPKTAKIIVDDVFTFQSKQHLKDPNLTKGRLVRIKTEKKDDKEEVTELTIYLAKKK